ncbi:fucose mutarotase [Orcinus orca]|uniref:fucose mutarotase n=1 Tax=Orcinus orca TaxID=9733 RepID=UPI001441F2CD|nr:fucose mutarotase [Orcinus orca]
MYGLLEILPFICTSAGQLKDPPHTRPALPGPVPRGRPALSGPASRVVLKGLPALPSPEPLYALARMGHGDEIGLGIPQRLEAVLQPLPLDCYMESPAVVVELVPSDRERGLQTPVWPSYQSILSRAGCASPLATIERLEFYEWTRKAVAVVTTGEAALYGNLILKKGLPAPDALFQAC